MTTLEQQVRAMLLDRELAPMEGLEERAQVIYRRQVRKSLLNGARLAIPVARKAVDPEVLEGILALWLERSPPTTRLYWRLSLDLAAWVAQMPDPPHPAFPELIHWETLEVDILNSPDAPAQAEPSPVLHPEKALLLDPSARLAIYQYPVYRMSTQDPSWPEAPLDQPAFVAGWRHQERFFWEALSPDVAQALAQIAQGATLSQALTALGQIYGEQLDAARVTSELQRLAGRGLLWGAPGA